MMTDVDPLEKARQALELVEGNLKALKNRYDEAPITATFDERIAIIDAGVKVATGWALIATQETLRKTYEAALRD